MVHHLLGCQCQYFTLFHLRIYMQRQTITTIWQITKNLFLDTLRIRTIAHNDIEDIERSTRGQQKNSKWMTDRCKRLTSYNFGRICKCTYCTDKVALARSYLSRKQIVQIHCVMVASMNMWLFKNMKSKISENQCLWHFCFTFNALYI